jgi:general secretion pathway protein G
MHTYTRPIHTPSDMATRRHAFTLLEVLLVVAILSAIASMVVPNVLARQRAANIDSTRINIIAAEQAMAMYFIDHPDSVVDPADAATALLRPGQADNNWNGPYVKTAPRDAWGRVLLATSSDDPTAPIRFYSSGADGTAGTADDIHAEDTSMMQDARP